MRINKWSPQEKAMIFYQILPTDHVRKCIEVSLENCMLILGLKG